MMNFNVKIRHNRNCLIAKVKIPSSLIINTNQSDLLARKFRGEFLKLHRAKQNKLEFVGDKGISLHKRLKKPVLQSDFFFIVKQLVDAIQEIEKIGLSRNNLLFDLKYMFFNESTKELSLIYLPLATPLGKVDVISFIEQMIYSAKQAKSCSDYLSDFQHFMKRFDDFDAKKIEAYIYQEESGFVSIIKNNFKKSGVESGAAFVPDDGNSNDDPTLLMIDDDATDIMPSADKPTVFPLNNGQICFKAENGKDNCSDDEATELFLDDDKTDLFDERKSVPYHFPTLTRTLTEETIKIEKPVFRIGKEENCVDYIVTNNAAISRSHADIISRGGKYFVFDLRSKNKSYINNRVLPAEHEVEIFSGDVLKLANEEFLFQV